jgi:YggT family protein
MTQPDQVAVTEAEASEQDKTSAWRGLLNSMHPKTFFSMADGYPVGVKQFLQFCLLLVYPGWLIAAPLCGAIYAVGYGILWVLFWPVRAWMKKNRPEEYAASQRK